MTLCPPQQSVSTTHGSANLSPLLRYTRCRRSLESIQNQYPKSLHDLHNDYPLAPEQIGVNKIDKLIPNLWDKKKYILHYENLKQYLSLGSKLNHIFRGIRFEESQWLKKKNSS